MLKNICLFILGLSFLSVISGCIPLLAGAAGGAGTAVWLSGKLTQEFPKTYDQTVNAAKEGLEDMNLDIDKETNDLTVTQLRSTYTDGKEVWVDIHKVTEESSRVDVRVGMSDKVAATKILQSIDQHL